MASYFEGMKASVQGYFAPDKEQQAIELAEAREESRSHVLTPEERAQLKALDDDIKAVKEKVAKGELRAGGGGKVVRKRGSANHRVPVKLTQVQATATNVWTTVDPDNLGASAGRVWGVYDSDGDGVMNRREVRLMVKDWIAAMPDICQVFFNDDISVEELKANIDFNAKQYTDSVFKYADKDQDNVITKLEWIRFFV